MKKQMTVRKTVLAALFLAIGLILPFITMQIPAIGKMLCPMHIPVLLWIYSRRTVWPDRWIYYTVTQKCDIWNACHAPECYMHGI